jgi:hypothetical protein
VVIALPNDIIFHCVSSSNLVCFGEKFLQHNLSGLCFTLNSFVYHKKSFDFVTGIFLVLNYFLLFPFIISP